MHLILLIIVLLILFGGLGGGWYGYGRWYGAPGAPMPMGYGGGLIGLLLVILLIVFLLGYL